jgi:hypothetical protein
MFLWISALSPPLPHPFRNVGPFVINFCVHVWSYTKYIMAFPNSIIELKNQNGYVVICKKNDPNINRNNLW